MSREATIQSISNPIHQKFFVYATSEIKTITPAAAMSSPQAATPSLAMVGVLPTWIIAAELAPIFTAIASLFPVIAILIIGIVVVGGAIALYDHHQYVNNNNYLTTSYNSFAASTEDVIANEGVGAVEEDGSGDTVIKSSDINWDVNDNTKNHIANGTDGSHQNGWNKFGIDPNDPDFWTKVLPFLKIVVDEGQKLAERAADNGGRIIEFIKFFPEKGMTIWVKIYEYSNGLKVISDACEYTQ